MIAFAAPYVGRSSTRASAFCQQVSRTRGYLPATRLFFGALIVASPFTGVRAESTKGEDSGVCMSADGIGSLSGLKTIDGDDLPVSKFSGKVTLAVNVASACGYTKSGYEMMSEVQAKYPDDVAVVAVPCNAFGRQENGTPEEIRDFASRRVSDVVVTERSEVNGPDSHPIIALGKAAFPGDIPWNFAGVFVFGREGKPVARLDNSASGADVLKEVEKVL